jgi:hypothetical protein
MALFPQFSSGGRFGNVTQPLVFNVFTPEKKSFLWLWLCTGLLTLMLGVLLALGLYVIVLVLIVLALGPFLIVYPRFGLWAAILGSLIVSGLIDLYAPKLRPLTWGLTVLSGGLAAISFGMYHLRVVSKAVKPDNSMLLTCALLFMVCTVCSTMANWHGSAAAAVGLKGFFQVWGIALAIYYLMQDEIDAGRLIKFLLLLGILQIPSVLHQFIFLVPLRTGMIAEAHGVEAVDVVAGTFGGQMNAGGRSSSLALLNIICMTILGALWRAKMISRTRVVVLSGIFMFPLLLNEAKIVVVLIPVSLFLLFRDQILRHLFKSLLVACGLVFGLFAMLSIYVMLPGETGDVVDMYNDTVAYNIGNKGYGNLVLNRTTVYPFWYNEHVRNGSVVTMLVGHGPGATNSGSAVVNDSLASKRYAGYGIGLTAISALLWEVGILGTGVVLALFYAAYRLGGRLSKRWEGTVHWPLLKAAEIAVPLFAANLIHNNYFVIDLSFQALLMVILGYLLAMSRFERKAP